MGLIRCNECGREISDKAATCPGCGAPVETVAKSPPPQPSEQTPINPTDKLWEEVHEAIYRGEKIQAIRIYREIMGKGYGLAEAKAAVERLTQDLQSKQPDKFTKAGNEVARSSNTQGCLVMVLLVALLAALSYAYFSSSDSPTTKPSDAGKDAYYSARQFVSQNLKAPRDADFSTPGVDNGTGWKASGPNRWEAFGYVDAQNSFGAKLRNEWRAVVEREGNGWRLIYLKLGSQEIGQPP